MPMHMATPMATPKVMPMAMPMDANGYAYGNTNGYRQWQMAMSMATNDIANGNRY